MSDDELKPCNVCKKEIINGKWHHCVPTPQQFKDVGPDKNGHVRESNFPKKVEKPEQINETPICEICFVSIRECDCPDEPLPEEISTDELVDGILATQKLFIKWLQDNGIYNNNESDHTMSKLFVIWDKLQSELTTLKEERIVDGAVLFKGDVYRGPRHCIIMLGIKTWWSQGEKMIDGSQGFITNTGRFVERLEARKIAIAAGQVKEEDLDCATMIFTEDLWEYPRKEKP